MWSQTANIPEIPNRLEDLPRLNIPWNKIPNDCGLPPHMIPQGIRMDYTEVGFTKRFFDTHEAFTLKDLSAVKILGVVYRWTDVATCEQMYCVERSNDKQVFLAKDKQFEALLQT